MKRKEFIKELKRNGCFLKRHGSRHDIYHNPKTKKSAPVPRHIEIADSLCELIRNQLEVRNKAKNYWRKQ
ncbi:MAG: type II toxin-antitoxin system HicA family toxin [Bacteroidota bacterium]|nr:type II toxin-antitoxin system HicA family toxin [Bacteroidota bacterium]